MSDKNDFSFVEKVINSEEFKKDFKEEKKENNVLKPLLWDIRYITDKSELEGKTIDFFLIKGKVEGNFNFYRKVEFYNLKTLFMPEDGNQEMEGNIKVLKNKNSDDFVKYNILQNPFIPEDIKYFYNPNKIYYVLGVNLGSDEIDSNFPFEKNKLIVYVFRERMFNDFMIKLKGLILSDAKKVEKLFSGKGFLRLNFSSYTSPKTKKKYSRIGSIDFVDDSSLEKIYERNLKILDLGFIKEDGTFLDPWDGNLESLYLSPSYLEFTQEKEDSVIKYINTTYKNQRFAEVKPVKEAVNNTVLNMSVFEDIEQNTDLQNKYLNNSKENLDLEKKYFNSNYNDDEIPF